MARSAIVRWRLNATWLFHGPGRLRGNSAAPGRSASGGRSRLWESAIAKLARDRAGELVKLAEELEG